MGVSQQRLDTLFEMRMNGELSSEEYGLRKEKLTEEKKKYEELIADIHHRAASWADNAKRLFSFAETAQERFETEKPMGLLKNIAPEVQALHARLEPAKITKPQRNWEVHYAKNQRMCARQESNLRPTA